MLLSSAATRSASSAMRPATSRRVPMRLAPLVVRADPKADIERVSCHESEGAKKGATGLTLFPPAAAAVRARARGKVHRRRYSNNANQPAPLQPPKPPPTNTATQQVQKVLESTLKEAEVACESDVKADECVAAFDAVEEVSAALSHKKQAAASSDPLEVFCEDNPDADECRVYDD
jgi:hypothetical protein